MSERVSVTPSNRARRTNKGGRESAQDSDAKKARNTAERNPEEQNGEKKKERERVQEMGRDCTEAANEREESE